ncbi:MAG: DUF2145 domain-containing protein [Burkholderiales bacterium]
MTAGNASCARPRSRSDPRRPARAVARVALASAFAAFAALAPEGVAHAGVLRVCEPPAELDAGQQDTLVRFAAVVRSTLEASGASLALVSRAGLDLARFGMRYSHAGVSLRASPNAPWSVRQLYYDCETRRPRLYDEGLAGFVVGAGEPSTGWVAAVLLPAGAQDALERAARDDRLALRLLAGTYSANAHAFALRYQNCNQWVAELLGVAWSGLGSAQDDLRGAAQRWLTDSGYAPARFEVRNPLLIGAAAALPWLHLDDHPGEDVAAGVFRVSMPASIEAFARARAPGARRVEFCHAGRRIVVREGWTPIGAACVPQPGDRVVDLDG